MLRAGWWWHWGTREAGSQAGAALISFLGKVALWNQPDDSRGLSVPTGRDDVVRDN